MISAFRIPLIPVDQFKLHDISSASNKMFDQLSTVFREVSLRDPSSQDEQRRHVHTIAGKTHRFARPLTFTPYASAQACSARCRFCSETLKDKTSLGPMSASLRPGPAYFSSLRKVLRSLQGVPLSYSLSGLESTDDPDWLLTLLDTLASEMAVGPVVEGSVMYTNGAGLAEHGHRLWPTLNSFGLSWIEWSRHHDKEEVNNKIMRFRSGQQIAKQHIFEDAVSETSKIAPVKFVCVVQRGSIDTPSDVLRYIDWACSLGAATVIFREFSALPDSYQMNATRRYIETARVDIDDLLQACLEDSRFEERHTPIALTKGYYFWNARWRNANQCEVVFEKSDYRALHAREASGRIYKLVFHANEHLCSGWQPDENILWTPNDSQ